MDFTLPNSEPDKTIPEFFLQAVKHPFKSEQAGREIFEDREFVRIITPGNMRSIPVEPVNDEHKRRWPRQYDAFQRGMEDPVEGTPLDQVAFLTPAVVQTLKALNVKTVESLAGVSDAILKDMPLGGRDLRQKAQTFLESADSTAPLDRANARAEAAEARALQLEGQLQELATRLSAIEDEDKGRRSKRAEAA